MRLKRLGIGFIMLSLLIGMLAACQPSFEPATFADDFGREIIVEKVPQRIVSHVPSITEILFALGLDEKIVGVSDYCNYPEAAKLKEKVGGYYEPSIEKIVALEPELVFTDGHVEYLMTQLDALGITYIVLQPEDIDGILRNIDLVGRVTDTEKSADKLVNDMKASMSQVVERVEGTPRPRVFYTFATTDLNNPWTAGPGSFVDSLITMAGGENIAAKAASPWVQFSIEEVVSSNPDVIIVDAGMGSAVTPLAEIEPHPVWGELTAVKQGRVYPIDGDLVNRSGPRIVQGLEEIAKIIHPELFQ